MESIIFNTLLNSNESETIEFKKCLNDISGSVFESICAFLNRNGGHLFIGITDDKKIIGVNETKIDSFTKNIINTLNNPQLFNPTIYIKPSVIEIDNKKVLYLNIPESSQVHRYKNKVFDRNADADNDITYNYQLIDNLHLRKRAVSTENIIFPYISLSDFDDNTFIKMRKHIAIFNQSHSWLEMTNEDFLRSAGFFRRDPLNNNE